VIGPELFTGASKRSVDESIYYTSKQLRNIEYTSSQVF